MMGQDTFQPHPQFGAREEIRVGRNELFSLPFHAVWEESAELRIGSGNSQLRVADINIIEKNGQPRATFLLPWASKDGYSRSLPKFSAPVFDVDDSPAEDGSSERSYKTQMWVVIGHEEIWLDIWLKEVISSTRNAVFHTGEWPFGVRHTKLANCLQGKPTHRLIELIKDLKQPMAMQELVSLN